MSNEIGTINSLSAGSAQLTLPPESQFWFIQNQDIAPLNVAFIGTRGQIMSSIVLTPAPTRGGAGGYLDSIGFPYFNTQGFELTSTIADGLFGSGFSFAQPVNDYPYPGSPQV